MAMAPKSGGDHTAPGVEDNAAPPEINPLDGIQPVKTNLQLTESQIRAMEERACLRIDELASQMGLYLDGTGRVDPTRWMGIKQKNQDQYDNEWHWRLALGGIFSYSNFSINISKRYARLMSAKARDDLIGTEPFFAIMPEAVSKEDAEMTKSAEKYLQMKIRKTNVKRSLAEGLKQALIIDEQVMKPTYVANVTKFRGPARVAVGPYVYVGPQGEVFTPPGEPVMTPAQSYIYENDDFIPDPAVEGQFRLRKEPNVQIRMTPEYEDVPSLDQTMIHQDGVDLRCVDFRDFLCPLNAASVHEADICVHLYDEQWERLVATYGIFEVSRDYVNQPYMSGEKSAKESKQEVQGEVEAGSQALKIVNCADCYMRMDVDDDGIEEEIWLILDRKAKKAIWYDYLGAHLKKRPFEVITGIEKVPNRWYGVGVFTMLDHKQMYIDTQFNRVNFKSSKNSSVRFRNRNAVSQWKAGQELVFGDDSVLDIDDPRFTMANPPLFQVQLTEIDEFAMKLIELMLQASSTEVGMVGPDDGNMAGLDTTKLATGIKSLERTANVLMKETEGSQADSVALVLDQVVDIALEHMDPNEVLYDDETNALLTLSREEIRNLGRHTRLLLTRSRSTETIETARMVVQLCREYYEALNPEEQNLLRTEYVRQLRALEVQDSDKLLRVVSDEEVAQWKQEQSEAAKLPPRTSIATKYPDLLRSEQVQVLTREGIQAGSDQEVAAKVMTDLAIKEREKTAGQPDPAQEAAQKADEHNQKMEQNDQQFRQKMGQKVQETQLKTAVATHEANLTAHTSEQKHRMGMQQTVEAAHAKAAAAKIAPKPSTNGEKK